MKNIRQLSIAAAAVAVAAGMGLVSPAAAAAGPWTTSNPGSVTLEAPYAGTATLTIPTSDSYPARVNAVQAYERAVVSVDGVKVGETRELADKVASALETTTLTFQVKAGSKIVIAHSSLWGLLDGTPNSVVVGTPKLSVTPVPTATTTPAPTTAVAPATTVTPTTAVEPPATTSTVAPVVETGTAVAPPLAATPPPVAVCPEGFYPQGYEPDAMCGPQICIDRDGDGQGTTMWTVSPCSNIPPTNAPTVSYGLPATGSTTTISLLVAGAALVILGVALVRWRRS